MRPWCQRATSWGREREWGQQQWDQEQDLKMCPWDHGSLENLTSMIQHVDLPWVAYSCPARSDLQLSSHSNAEHRDENTSFFYSNIIIIMTIAVVIIITIVNVSNMECYSASSTSMRQIMSQCLELQQHIVLTASPNKQNKGSWCGQESRSRYMDCKRRRCASQTESMSSWYEPCWLYRNEACGIEILRSLLSKSNSKPLTIGACVNVTTRLIVKICTTTMTWQHTSHTANINPVLGMFTQILAFYAFLLSSKSLY